MRRSLLPDAHMYMPWAVCRGLDECLRLCVICFLDVARPRQAIGQAERRIREASPRGSVGGGRASSRK
eukprot:1171152-Prorocentrum_minimum.AAC.2